MPGPCPWALLLWASVGADAAVPLPRAVPFQISVVDNETGAGVPLVLLRTGGYLEYFTDSAGVVAFDEHGLLGQPVWFSVSHGRVCH